MGNLAWATTDETLLTHMSGAGSVTSASVLRYSDSGRSKGSGLVDFTSAEDAERAIAELTDTELDGRQIFVRADRGGMPPGSRPPRRTGGGEGTGRRAERTEGRRTGGDRPAPRSSTPFGPTGEPGTAAFVKNLAWETTDIALLDFFGDFKSTAAEISRRDGRSRGWGIVRFATVEDRDAAVAERNDHELDGRALHVREYRED